MKCYVSSIIQPTTSFIQTSGSASPSAFTSLQERGLARLTLADMSKGSRASHAGRMSRHGWLMIHGHAQIITSPSSTRTGRPSVTAGEKGRERRGKQQITDA